jgi:hypothetical protein
MRLMLLLSASIFLCYYQAKSSSNDPFPKIKQGIEKRMTLFSEATGMLWEYKLSKEPDGKLIGMFCSQISAVYLKNRKRFDTLVNVVIEPFFMDYIIENQFTQYKALCFCFTVNTDSCFQDIPQSALYTFHITPDTGSLPDLPYKAGMLASLIGEGTKSTLILTNNKDYPGEIEFKVPKKSSPKTVRDREEDAKRWARLAYSYLLKTKEAEENHYRRISICYYNTNNPAEKEYFMFDKNNPLFSDL